MSIFNNKELEQLKAENQALQSHLARLSTPQYQNVMFLEQRISELQRNLAQVESQINTRATELRTLYESVKSRQKEIVQLDEEILMQSFGLYRPRYAFANSEQYKDRLQKVRSSQKECIKNGQAATGMANWTVNGDAKKGAQMVKDMQKLLIRAFNTECDDTIDHVKFNNLESSIKRITQSKEAISKLGKIMDVSITDRYFSLKMSELYLAYEYGVIKQQEKEEQQRLREEMREQAKAQKELEEARNKIRKEQTHYQNQYDDICKQLQDDLSDDRRAALEEKKAAISDQLSKINASVADIDYRAANQKAGYVYIISNIGAFGDNIYKIGMTRRLDPMDRVNELGDASVPFGFDVHAMIFSADAPALEAALHNAFASKRVNMVNQRREFFNVSLDEIEAVVKANYDKAVEFKKIPDAEQYRQSLLMRQQISK